MIKTSSRTPTYMPSKIGLKNTSTCKTDLLKHQNPKCCLWKSIDFVFCVSGACIQSTYQEPVGWWVQKLSKRNASCMCFHCFFAFGYLWNFRQPSNQTWTDLKVPPRLAQGWRPRCLRFESFESFESPKSRKTCKNTYKMHSAIKVPPAQKN